MQRDLSPQPWRARYALVLVYGLQSPSPVLHALPPTGQYLPPPCGARKGRDYLLVLRSVVNGRECQRCRKVVERG